MTKEDYRDLNNALALLHDFIENFSGELCIKDDRGILNSAMDVLRGYVSCGGEV
jgi:hypothetical protein